MKRSNHINGISYLSIRKFVLQHRGPRWSILQKATLPWRRGFLRPPKSPSWIHLHLRPNRKTMNSVISFWGEANILKLCRGDSYPLRGCSEWTAHFENTSLASKTASRQRDRASLSPTYCIPNTSVKLFLEAEELLTESYTLTLSLKHQKTMVIIALCKGSHNAGIC